MRGRVAALWILVLLGTADRSRASDFWDEVRTPGLQEYRGLVRRGTRALEENRPLATLELAARAIARLPDRRAAHLLQARAFFALARYGDALRAFERAIELGAGQPLEPHDGVALAVSAIHTARLGIAREALGRALSASGDPDTRRDLLVMTAHVTLASGPAHLQRALQLFREALRTAGPDRDTLLGLALATHRDGRAQEALALARRALALDARPRPVGPAWLPGAERAGREAMLHLARGEQEAARRSLRESRRAGPWCRHSDGCGPERAP
ncbi:MAG: tetratricopeptide repeat protein [Myxococcales bacterium]|jgi:tetratricopeptide (TPR) repeat protein